MAVPSILAELLHGVGDGASAMSALIVTRCGQSDVGLQR